MEVLRRVWAFLNGKKTLAGTVLGILYVGAVMEGHMMRDETIEWALVSLTGVGVGHKFVKAAK